MPTNSIKTYGEKSFLYIVRKNGDKYRFVFDTEDKEFVLKNKWHVVIYNKTPLVYAQTKVKNKNRKMHRLLLGYEGKLDVDHINGNSLDNRKKNLRIVTRSVNCLNRKPAVSYFKGRPKPWRATIEIMYKRKDLGYYRTKKEAVEAGLKYKRDNKLIFN